MSSAVALALAAHRSARFDATVIASPTLFAVLRYGWLRLRLQTAEFAALRALSAARRKTATGRKR